jgi:hypothetical protein
MEEYGFRIRFRLPDSVQLGIGEVTWELAPGVWMRSLVQDQPIKDASALAVRGEGCGSVEEATRLGERWRDALETAFARLGVGADFGEQGPRSYFSEAGIRLMEQASGSRVLNDEPGLSVFSLHPPPRFVGGSAAGMMPPPNEAKTKAAITLAFASGPHHTPAQRLAFDLYSASFFQPAADARLLMLMMAIETMLDPQDRDEATSAHVRELMRLTREADLPDSQKQSLLGSLEWMLQESISQSGRRLAASLTGRTYMDQTPQKFFTICYELRSRLVHGATPRPDFERVNTAAGQLKLFVGHLLSGSLLIGLPD